MPGILPMKVIKVGTSAQSRIAQACDRCRSKKIRCDGITPCCSQCENVGFECKTSDKLSRRAFPRGYTESLEERVRSLESEVKELKDLLDGKDEKIDLLTRVYSQSPPARRPSSTFSASTYATSRTSSISAENVKDDNLKRASSATSQGSEAYNHHKSEASTGRPFIDAFKKKLESIGQQRSSLQTDAFFCEPADKTDDPSSLTHDASRAQKIPSRMASDQMINIFLQEWSPLFPILNRQATLKEYTEFVADPEGLDDDHTIAKLYLIFCIGAISAEASHQWNKHDSKVFEAQWTASLHKIKKDVSISTIQCLLLAQIYCIAKRDLPSLKRYKSAAIQMSRRLALHQSQKRSSLGPLATEARKRIFWTLYTIDCFSAAILGEPRAVCEDDIRCEYPQDVDDENIADDGFLPALPGELTRVSSALALFRGARILASVLDEVYSAKPSSQLSFRRLAELNEDLDSWSSDLPAHLRLQFVQDKPSTNVVGSRSPFLSLTYHYIRTLIHRPSTTCTSHRASTSIVALAESSKHIIQILQLLDERRMSFSVCLNKDHVLTLAGFGLLFQTVSLDRKGKLTQDTERLLCSVISSLEKNEAPGASEFKEITCAMISVQPPSKPARPAADDSCIQRQRDQSMPAPKSTTKLCRKIKNPITRNSSPNSPPVKVEGDTGRSAITPLASQHLPYQHKRHEGPSQLHPFASDPAMQRTQAATPYRRPSESSILPNLDYLDFGDEPRTDSDPSGTKTRKYKVQMDHATAEREAPQIQPLDPVFPSPDVFSYMAGSPTSNNTFDWCTDFWNMSTDLNDQGAPTALSFSEEDLASSEGYSSSGRSGGVGSGKMSREDGSVVVNGLDGLESLDG